jgi:hypothetical protein
MLISEYFSADEGAFSADEFYDLPHDYDDLDLDIEDQKKSSGDSATPIRYDTKLRRFFCVLL